MNSHESEKIESQLLPAGYKKGSKEDADVLVFNTCCIRNTAENKVISHIGETKRSGKIVCVVGCLAQKEGAKLKKKFPHIKIILGTHNIDKLGYALQQPKGLIEIIAEREVDAEYVGSKKYVNITYGCENYCSYCIVPYVRGKLISRDSAVVRKEFEKAIESGGLIYLLGQNVNSYLCPVTGKNFAQLLDELSSLEGDYQVNFLSSHPKDFSDELIKVIAKNEKIERNIHLPVQSGCDRILQEMNRGYTTQEYKDKISKLRDKVNGVRITTDIICGFPTETEEEHMETLEFIRDVKFNAAFIFPYSRRTGTRADTMDGQLVASTKKRRATEAIMLMRELTSVNREAKIK